MKVSVEIDLPDEIADKYDVEYRLPREGENYWDVGGQFTGTAEFNFSRDCHFVIIPKFNLKEWWPKWLIAPWIAMDESGNWYSYSDVPSLGGSSWIIGPGELGRLSNLLQDFTPPPGFTADNWRESKLKNPHL